MNATSTIINTTGSDYSIADHQRNLAAIYAELDRAVVGQTELKLSLALSLAVGRPLMISGPVGLVKSYTTKVMSRIAGDPGGCARIQCDVGTMPADFTGYLRPSPFTETETLVHGPLFQRFVHIDEINRATARALSGVLEAMEEKTITIGGVSYPVPDGQLIVFTLNPSEHAGTDKLPDAVLDRAGICCVVGRLTDRNERIRVAKRDYTLFENIKQQVSVRDILALQQEAVRFARNASPEAAGFAADIIDLTHQRPEVFSFGASDRAIEVLLHFAAAHALYKGSGSVGVQDVIDMAPRVLRHRVTPNSDTLFDDESFAGNPLGFADLQIRSMMDGLIGDYQTQLQRRSGRKV